MNVNTPSPADPQAAATNAPATIPSGRPPTTAQDYAALFALGLDLCERLTQDSWTDYNEHDPGVTILEQLCYALTDLGLRNRQSMPVLLAPAPGTTAPFDTLVSGERILTSAPWTIADYRRLLYDRVVHLRNAWLVPPSEMQAPVQAAAPDGLYEVRLESFHEDFGDEDERNAIVAAVSAQMRAQRNVGEDLARVVLLEAHALTVYGTIEVGIHADAEDVLAEVLFRLQHVLVPAPEVQLPGALLQAGVPPDEVFRGPRLGVGVIDARNLADYKRCVKLEEVIDIMLAVPDVRRVSGVRLEGEGLNARGDMLALRENEVPRLKPSIFAPPTGPYTIAVQLEGGIAQTIDAASVYRGIEARIAALTDEQNYTELQTRTLDYGRPARAAYIDLAQYTSIQHQFPMTYGIGRDGVPALPRWRVDSSDAYGNADALAPPVTLDRRRREALAQQLKGYLLLFEQLLANHLEQLANAWQLFALDLSPAAARSYFSQPLVHTPAREADPPDVFGLLSQMAGPDGTERARHGVYVVDGERRVVLVGRENGDLTEAHAVRAEILGRGAAASAYRIERVEHPEQGAQPEFRLVIDAADGSLLAVGEERYGTAERTQAAIERVAALIARCADEPARAARHLIVHALSGIMVRIVDEGGRIVLDSGPLPTSAERERREAELLRHGVAHARYRMRRDDNGWLRLTLHNAEAELVALGEIRYPSIESAQVGRDQLIAWLRRLRGDSALRATHIERLPSAEYATPSAYLSELAALTARFDPAVERRNRFLDHLLARFGERFDNGLLTRLDPRDDGGAALRAALQRAKTVFLRNIVPLTAGRATGPNYGEPLGPPDVGPEPADEPADGFARRLALLLGIEVHTDATGALRPTRYRMTRDTPPFLYVEREEPVDAPGPRANRRSYTVRATQPGIVANLLKHGVSAAHYGERHDVRHEGVDSWALTFTWPGGEQQDIHRAESREAVHAARQRLIRHLSALAGDAHALFSGEGFHVVEHILLRPDDARVDDDFYRLRVSILFPDWPVRFQDPEFRAFALRTVFDNTPAHLDVRCYWLGFGEMTEFERLDDAWRHGLYRYAAKETGERPVDAAAALRAFIERVDRRDGAAL